jgi:thiosulfate/3-mercaptopyruvate sulfurtransferase
MTASNYTNPDVLVDTSWVAAHLDDPTVRLVEAVAAARRHETGHIPGAVLLDWRTDLQSETIRDFVTREEFEERMAARGIASDTTVVLYGGHDNRHAACAYWLFKLYGHRDCRILNGGRAQWEAEGRSCTRQTPDYPRSAYQARPADLSIRAFRDQVLAHVYASQPLIDARSPEEYKGEAAHTAQYPGESAQRAGHIPSARNVPWSCAINGSGTFKDAVELRALYQAQGLNPDQPVIAYSHTGARSAHTWFVLTQLLGYPDVRNYDGSWAEWGGLVRAPIEREHSAGTNR